MFTGRGQQREDNSLQMPYTRLEGLHRPNPLQEMKCMHNVQSKGRGCVNIAKGFNIEIFNLLQKKRPLFAGCLRSYVPTVGAERGESFFPLNVTGNKE